MLEGFIRDEIAIRIEEDSFQEALHNRGMEMNMQLDPGERPIPREAYEVASQYDLSPTLQSPYDASIKMTMADGSVYVIAVHRESGPEYN